MWWRKWCLMSWVSRALAQSFPQRSAIEFRHHGIAKTYPIERCRVRITQLPNCDDFAAPQTNGALGQELP